MLKTRKIIMSCEGKTGAALKKCQDALKGKKTLLKKQEKKKKVDKSKVVSAYNKSISDKNAAANKARVQAKVKRMNRPVGKKLSDAATTVGNIFKKKTPAQREINKNKRAQKKVNRKSTGSRWNGDWN